MAQKKKLVPWSDSELKLLRRLFPKGRVKEIADQTGRTLAAVIRKAGRMGLTGEYHLWSGNEVRLLKKLYPNENARNIADKLGRSWSSINQKAYRLGLKTVRAVYMKANELGLKKKS